ncbi:BREX protein BrxB domain-containing protein [Candidatus Palauibacter sp.]|uniref:BREX protein BrxB domain-containing protein n=1 Tax=Candidatus Palauibacter sp. TaxID=3101350 RepID=UPI003B01DE98
MSQIEKLAKVYERHVGVEWQRTMAGAQRVMLAVYPKEKERLLRARVGEFEEATRRTGHEWALVDATGWFAEWMAAHEYRESYFEDPELLDLNPEGEFWEAVEGRLRVTLEAADEETVVALLGIASLYGFLRVSELVRAVETSIRGRLLVFFPGTKNENNYRLLDARDGWNYLAQPITLHEAWVP